MISTKKIIAIFSIIVLIVLSIGLYNENKNLKEKLEYCCIGTWINSSDGQGYSGARKNFYDIPASPFTGEACYLKID